MHIVVWWGGAGLERKFWRWHAKNKARIVASGQGFPVKSQAMDAAKAAVRGFLKPLRGPNFKPDPPRFKQRPDGKLTILEWY